MILAKVKSEKGSAFILALMVVAAVGLLVVPVIYLATTGLRSTNLAQQRFLERYAADAGVEEGIWLAIDNPPEPGSSSHIGIQSNFNNLPTTIDIEAVGFPDPMTVPIPLPDQPPGSGQNVYIDTTVTPNYVPPCDLGLGPGGCTATTFTYTLFIQNYGSSLEKITRLGVCLPAGFTFTGVVENVIDETGIYDGVTVLYWGSSGDPLATVEDLAHPFAPSPMIEGNGMSPPIVDPKSSDPADLDPPCGPERQQVRWRFGPSAGLPWLNLGDYRVARLSFKATAILELPAEHPNTSWIELNSTTGQPLITLGETSPVFVKYPEYDIRSTAGGTTVEARAAVNGATKESYILSWQVE